MCQNEEINQRRCGNVWQSHDQIMVQYPGSRVIVIGRGGVLWNSQGSVNRIRVEKYAGRFRSKCGEVNTDASAAKGMANRRGLGKVRHIAVNQLWIQDRVAKGDLSINKVNGKENIADILTKHVSAEDIRVHLHRIGQSITTRRHSIAPENN